MRDLLITGGPALWAIFHGLKKGWRRRRLVPLLRGKAFHGGRY